MDINTFRPIIRTQLDLENAWRHLMGPLGFSDHRLWMMLIGPDGRPIPHLVEVTQAAEAPGPDELNGLGAFLAELREDLAGSEGRVAFLRSRPGYDGIGPLDRAWATSLHAVCRAVHVECETVHLATDAMLVPLPLDELGVAVG